MTLSLLFSFFFFNDTATTEIYTLSLHDALPISQSFGTARGSPPAVRRYGHDIVFSCDRRERPFRRLARRLHDVRRRERQQKCPDRSEEHTSELQSQSNLVCRLLLEKKKKKMKKHTNRKKSQKSTQHVDTNTRQYCALLLSFYNLSLKARDRYMTHMNGASISRPHTI